MLGWNISVHRLAAPSAYLSTSDVLAISATLSTQSGGESLLASLTPGKRVVVWQTPGLEWIEDLVKGQQAICLPTNGWPRKYLAQAGHVIPRVVEGPPNANEVWLCGAHDIIGPGWAAKTVIDEAEAMGSSPGEWLLVIAWDED